MRAKLNEACAEPDHAKALAAQLEKVHPDAAEVLQRTGHPPAGTAWGSCRAGGGAAFGRPGGDGVQMVGGRARVSMSAAGLPAGERGLWWEVLRDRILPSSGSVGQRTVPPALTATLDRGTM